ncbi:hypothetical protein [Enterococcus timonensis]|uniref:hypothetical protein n=1 Tax=Enterococcus timonensis TaxID=1852364 RepID=UPI0008D9F3DC|nr:hypothetical protein [Enterococcus timonensis]
MLEEIRNCSDEQLQQFVTEIFMRNLTSGQLAEDSKLLLFLANTTEVSLAAVEKICLQEFIWRNLVLDKSLLHLPENWQVGSAADYLDDVTALSVRERN